MHTLRRRLRYGFRLAGLLLLTGLPLTMPAAAAAAASFTDTAMRDALANARDQRFERIDDDAIAGHVLGGYIDYHRLKRALPDAPSSRVNRFIQANDDSPLAGWMRGQAISAYGEAGRFDALLAVADGSPQRISRQCHYQTALLERDTQTAQEAGKALWLAGRSRPDACDPLFNRLRRENVIDADAIWQRAMLAWQAGNAGLMDYLLDMLGERWQTAVTRARAARQDLSALGRAPDCLGPKCRAGDGFYQAAMQRLTRKDTREAFLVWQELAPRITITSRARASIREELAFYALVRETPGTLGWIDEVLPTLDSQRVRELRVRRALASRAWRDARDWIEQMHAAEQEDSRWQYWLARADEQQDNDAAAHQHYEAATQERDFYGLAAADRLGRPYSLHRRDDEPDTASRTSIAALPEVKRAEALIRIDEPGLATSEWLQSVRRASPRRARAMADYAAHKAGNGHAGWTARLIQTTIAAGMWDALDWRFPEAYTDAFQRFGQQHDVDPYLLMAIARRESAYNPEARSSAGALGLMQLMPGTADDVSRSLGLEAPGRYGVLDPDLNIRLGSAYFGDILARYGGNRLAATAAYNAGPRRVDRWLKEHDADAFDLFVEQIPFRETRRYVQAVLTYRVIYQRLARDERQPGKASADPIALLTDAEKNARYNRELLSEDRD